MALLRAYFDESGTHGGSKVTGVAGFVGPEAEWTALESEWESELARFSDITGKPITELHAYDCVNGQDFWFGIDRAIREAYYLRLAPVLVKYKRLRGIAISVEVDDWDNQTTPEFRRRFDSPYQLCAEHCFQQLVSYTKNKANGSQSALLFAEHPKYTGRIEGIFRHYMSNKAWADVKTLAFASPKDCTPLQCSDMMSYEAYRYWERIERGDLSFAHDRDAFKVLADAGHFSWSACYGGLGLRNAVAKYHFNEGLAPPFTGG